MTAQVVIDTVVYGNDYDYGNMNSAAVRVVTMTTTTVGVHSARTLRRTTMPCRIANRHSIPAHRLAPSDLLLGMLGPFTTDFGVGLDVTDVTPRTNRQTGRDEMIVNGDLLLTDGNRTIVLGADDVVEVGR